MSTITAVERRSYIKRPAPPDPARSRRRSQWLIGLMALAAFGPYLAGSIRTEQLTIYLSVLVALVALPSLAKCAAPFLLTWSGILLVASLTLIAPVTEHLPWGPGTFLAGVDNFLLPLAVMLVVWTLVKRADATPALETVGRITVWASTINAVLSIARSQGGLEEVLRPFWGSGASATTVAGRAETMGRFAGIFNQPAEAGLVYSLALILAVWLYARKPHLLYPAIILITVGGIMTVSKIFIFIGLPLGAWYLLRRYGLLGRILTIFGLVALFTVVSQMGFIQTWNGLDYFTRLFEAPEGGGAVAFYTAGRWNEGSGVLAVIGSVLANRPLTGFGFAGMSVAYDSSWTEIMVVSGLLGAVLMAGILAGILVMARRTADPGMRILTYLMGLVLIGASTGIPALTVNRAATLVWLIIALLALARTPREMADRRAPKRVRQSRGAPVFQRDLATGRVHRERPHGKATADLL